MSPPANTSLHRLLSGDDDRSDDQADDGAPGSDEGGYSYTVPAALDLLAELQGEDALADRRAASQTLSAAELPLDQLRRQLKASARSRGQLLAIEVSSLMMEQIANDVRLLPPVRHLISLAEPAYLRLALADPRFFSAKNHPARRLLDTVIGQSLVYDSEQSDGFVNFMEDLGQLTSALTERPVEVCDAAYFSRLLLVFKRDRSRRLNSVVDGRDLAVKALLQAEERNLLADKLALEIRARRDFPAGSRVIGGFMTGPWAQVLAQEKLLRNNGGVETGSEPVFRNLLPDLFWSLEAKPQHRKRLVQMIPGLLETLREGLIFIDYPMARSKPFFDELMAVHQRLLQLDVKPTTASAQEAVPAAEDFQPSEPWLAPTEAEHSGFLDLELSDTDEEFELTLPQQLPDPEAIDLVSQLDVGSWVELVRDGNSLRAQLTWASPHNTLFMFSSAGGRTHSMTRRALQRLHQQGALKQVSNDGLVESAFESAASQAMRQDERAGS